MRELCVLALLLTAALPAWGQQRRALAWDFPRTSVSAITAFGIATVDGRGGIQQLQVPPSDPGACDWAPEVSEDTFCAALPCPAGGSVTAYWVQALAADASSLPTNVLTCWTLPNSPACPCLDPSQAPPGLPLPPSTPPVLTPPPTMPPLSTDPPPLPQRTAEGLHLLPIGPLPVVASIPAIPASTGA
jgi:U5 snRNP spliceosome subunit